MAPLSYQLGILAYGSLIDEPGNELEPLIIDRINCTTPFNVEFARLSASRSNAPTIIPFEAGSTVKAVVLVLDDQRVTYSQAQSMLWRRETRATDTAKTYKAVKEPGPNKVTILELNNFSGVSSVLYTAIGQNMGMMNNAENLAAFAIQSILNEAGEEKKDGIHYLLAAKKNGIVTKLSVPYELAILKQTGTKSLEAAITKLDALRPASLANKAAAKVFEANVREIADLIADYGFRTTFGDQVAEGTNLMDLLKGRNKEFVTNCHRGFKEAQKKILTLMLELEDRKIDLNNQLKAAKIDRNKTNQDELAKQIKVVAHRQNVLRHLIDSIAWQMIDGQLYIARRMYLEVEGEKILKHANLESVLAVVEQINAIETDFALMSDLSSYIQTGDLLCNIGGQLVLSEVKAGTRNHEILEILAEVQASDIPMDQVEEKYKLDKHSFKQLKRQAKQVATMKNFATIVNTDQGIDSSTGAPINIITPREPTQLYTDRLIALKKQLDTQNLWAYTVVDECLHIGMYKDHFRFIGPKILKSLGEANSENFMTFNYLNVINSLNRPLFYLPFESEFIFDLLFGRATLHFMLDLDKFLMLYERYGLKAEWGSRKESHKARELIGKSMFLRENKGIKIMQEDTKEAIWLADGTFLKMFFDAVQPAYIAYSANYNFENVAAEKQ